MNLRGGIALVVLGLALTLPAPTADAKVEITKGDQGRKVDTISKGECRVSGKKGNRDFFLVAKSDSGKFLLSVFIDAPVFKGFNKFYTAFYGGEDPQFFLHRNSDDHVFGNLKLPGTPPGTVYAGGVAFRKVGRLVGIGLYGAVNKQGTEGYTFVGPLKCKYRHRRK